MNGKLFMSGVACAASGLVFTQIAQDHGRLPYWAGMVNLGLLGGWVIFTALSFIFKETR